MSEIFGNEVNIKFYMKSELSQDDFNEIKDFFNTIYGIDGITITQHVEKTIKFED